MIPFAPLKVKHQALLTRLGIMHERGDFNESTLARMVSVGKQMWADMDHAVKIGRFLGMPLAKHKARIVIGRHQAVQPCWKTPRGGVTASGGDAYLLHVTTTPSVSFINNSV